MTPGNIQVRHRRLHATCGHIQVMCCAIFPVFTFMGISWETDPAMPNVPTVHSYTPNVSYYKCTTNTKLTKVIISSLSCDCLCELPLPIVYHFNFVITWGKAFMLLIVDEKSFIGSTKTHTQMSLFLLRSSLPVFKIWFYFHFITLTVTQ